MNKKIVISLSIIAAVAAVVMGGTSAFFSDTETSTGNTFTAGAIDLKVDSQQHYNNAVCVNGLWQLESGASLTVPQYPVIGTACGGTWGQTQPGVDITNEQFFNFGDIKPGDSGEDTISLHVVNNDAWLCASVASLASNDNGLTEPEGLVDTSDGAGNGELDNTMVWTVWRDDGAGGGVAGDNIHQSGEQVLTSGNPTNGTLAVYDSTTGTGALAGGSTAYLGVSWSLPLATGNEAQTDSLTGDISFEVVQSRNNGQFVCGQSQTPAGPEVGSTFVGYAGPGTCNVTVDDTGDAALDTIAEGITAATAGQTVCVADGTYTGPFEVNKNITLASINGPSATTLNGGVKITSSDATVKGFTVNTGIVSGEPNPVGFYVASGSNILIDSNDIDGNSVALSSGVLFVTGAAYTNVDVTNNDIHHNNAGIYTNPHTGTIDITLNDIFDNNAGIGGLMGATVTNNEFTHTGVSQEAIGIDSTFDSNRATANFNNFLSGVQLNDYGAVAVMNAENNFFNLGSAAQIDAGQFDAAPEAGAAYAHN